MSEQDRPFHEWFGEIRPGHKDYELAKRAWHARDAEIATLTRERDEARKALAKAETLYGGISEAVFQRIEKERDEARRESLIVGEQRDIIRHQLAEALAREALAKKLFDDIQRGTNPSEMRQLAFYGFHDTAPSAALLLALARAAVAEAKAENHRRDYPNEVGRTMEAKVNRRAAVNAALVDPTLALVLKEKE